MRDRDQWQAADGTALNAQPLGEGFVVWRAGRPVPAARRPATRVSLLGRDRAKVVIDGRQLELRLRHSEIVALLALRTAGMTVRELACEIYGSVEHKATVRSEMTRLRPLLGEALHSRPYRLDESVQIDLLEVQHKLEAGNRADALRLYTGPLLLRSKVPAIAGARAQLERGLGIEAPEVRRAVGGGRAG